MALAPSFCRGAVRLLAIDAKTILGLSHFTSSPTNKPAKNGHGHFRQAAQYWLFAFATAAAACAVYDRHINTRCMSYPSQEIGLKGRDTFLIFIWQDCIDCDGPNNQAFELIANHGVGIEVTRKCTQDPISYTYQGLRRHMDQHKPNQESARLRLIRWLSTV